MYFASNYGTNRPQVKCVLRVPRMCLRVCTHVFACYMYIRTLIWLHVVSLNHMRVLLLHKCTSINHMLFTKYTSEMNSHDDVIVSTHTGSFIRI